MIHQYEIDPITKEKGKLIKSHENIDEIAKLFINDKRSLNAVKTNIRQSMRATDSTAYGYIWKSDIETLKRKRVDKAKDKLIETEMKVLGQRMCMSKKTKYHSIFFFDESQADKLEKAINKRFSKYNFNVDWYPYSLEPLTFIMELKR